MISFVFSKKCYSCSACINICPHNAIEMDSLCRPIINTKNCVDCHACESVCPVLNKEKKEAFQPIRGLVVQSLDDGILLNSSSGGVFFLLAEKAIKDGWYVCGCVFDNSWHTKHIVSNRIEDIHKMMGSKYEKSDLSDCFSKIKALVKGKINVLFAGTPCQIAGLKAYIRNNNYLHTIAVVCHGSIERDVWDNYLKPERDYGNIVILSMRDKSKGWLNYGMKFVFEDGAIHSTYRNENGYFLNAFTMGYLERDRCLDCKIKGASINADLLLGDAWSLAGMIPDVDIEKGVSSVVVISSEGEKLIQGIIDKTKYVDVPTEDILRSNPRISTPAEKPINLNSFRRKVSNNPSQLRSYCEKYSKQPFLIKVVNKLRRI